MEKIADMFHAKILFDLIFNKFLDKICFWFVFFIKGKTSQFGVKSNISFRVSQPEKFVFVECLKYKLIFSSFVNVLYQKIVFISVLEHTKAEFPHKNKFANVFERTKPYWSVLFAQLLPEIDTAILVFRFIYEISHT